MAGEKLCVYRRGGYSVALRAGRRFRHFGNEVFRRDALIAGIKVPEYLSRQPGKIHLLVPNRGTGGNAVTLYADFNPGGRRLTTKEAYLGAAGLSAGSYGESPMSTTGISWSRSVRCMSAASLSGAAFPSDFRRKSTAEICCAAGSRTRSFAGTCTAVFRQTGKQRRQGRRTACLAL